MGSGLVSKKGDLVAVAIPSVTSDIPSYVLMVWYKKWINETIMAAETSPPELDEN